MVVVRKVTSRYSQTEREALAVVWACEHFDIYVRGSSFTVVTNHKPLVHVWSKPRPPLRIARWSLRLQPYYLTIVFRPGKDNPADYMSRHPATKDVRSSREEKIAEEYVESFHRPLYLMQSHSRKYEPPPRKTRYFKPLSNYATPDAGMKSTSMTLTRPHCVNSRTSEMN